MKEDLLNEACSQFKKGCWKKEEDQRLLNLMKSESSNWKSISEKMKTRSPIQCFQRWTKTLMPGLVKGQWIRQENEIIKNYVKKYGPVNWNKCAKLIPGRSSKQCREHWIYCLSPNIIKGNWTKEEDLKIFYLYKVLNGCWKDISMFFDGRPANSIKNRFYMIIRKIAGDILNIKGKKYLSEIGLNVLLNYLDEAYKEVESAYKKEKQYSDNQVKDFLKNIQIKITENNKNKKNNITENFSEKDTLSIRTKEQGSNDTENYKDNLAYNQDFIFSCDLDHNPKILKELNMIEKKISENCELKNLFNEDISKFDVDVDKGMSKAYRENLILCDDCYADNLSMVSNDRNNTLNFFREDGPQENIFFFCPIKNQQCQI